MTDSRSEGAVVEMPFATTNEDGDVAWIAGHHDPLRAAQIVLHWEKRDGWLSELGNVDDGKPRPAAEKLAENGVEHLWFDPSDDSDYAPPVPADHPGASPYTRLDLRTGGVADATD